MSKTITRKIKTKDKGEGQLGVADIDPHELDVRRTRHGTYPAPGTPTGTTWKLQLQKFRDKKEERSPSSNMVSSSTEAMDSDEAQKATAAIVQKLVKKQAEEAVTEGEPPSLADEQETLMTKDQIDQKLAKKREDRKSSSSESGEVDLNDSIVTFKSAVSETNEVSRAALSEELDDTAKWEGDTSKRPPMEEEDEDATENTLVTDNTNIEKLVKIKPTPKMTYISSEGTSKDDPIPRKEEVTNKGETGKTIGRKEKEEDKEKQPPLQVEPTCDFYLPLMGNPKVTDFPIKRKEITPMGGSVGRVIEVPFWEDMFGTRYFGVDIKYGLVYTIKNGKWEKLVQRCNTFPQEQYEFKGVSPKTVVGGVTSPRELDTLQSKIGVPIAESTRKPKFQRVRIQDLGASYSDLNTLDFSDSTITSSEEAEQINKEIEATESARQALEKERTIIEKEKMRVIRQQYEITKARLKAAKKRRREVLQAIKEEGMELEKQKKLTSDLRKQKREKLRQRMLEQLKLEENVCDEYLEYLKHEDADSDYLTEVSTLQEEQKVPEVGKEAMLVALIAKQLQMEDNLIRWRKLYEAKVKEDPDHLKLINQQYEEERQKMEIQLEEINGVMDLYLTKERQKEVEEKEIEMAKIQEQEEERKALEERKIQELEMKIQKEKEEQDKKRMIEMQKQRAEYQARKQQLLNAKIEKERLKQEEIQKQMRQLQKERGQMQDIHEEYLQWKERKDKEKFEKRWKKNQERIKKKEEKKEALKMGEDERTIPPRYRDKEKTSSKKTLTHPTSLAEPRKKKLELQETMEKEQTQEGPHWNVDPHDLSGELYRKYIKKEILGTSTRKNRQGQPDLYCYDCRKEHWGPCECAICGKTGHDEDECPELGNQDIEDPEMTPEYEKRCKPRREKGEITQEKDTARYPRRTQHIFCTFCEQEGHSEKRCPIREKMLAEKQEEEDIPLNSTMDREIQDRVERLRRIDKELDKKKRILQDIEEKEYVKEPKLEPKDDANTGYNRKPAGRKTSTPAQGRGPPRKQTEREDQREPPRRGNNLPGGGDGGDEPDPGDGDDEDSSNDDTDDDDEEEEETESSEEESEDSFVRFTRPILEGEREASDDSSLLTLWDIFGRRLSKAQWKKWKKYYLDEIEKFKNKEYIGPYIARGRRGHRGQDGLVGPPGPPGPPGQDASRREYIPPSVGKDPNVTLDTSALEQSFKKLGESMEKVWGAQYEMNRMVRKQLDASNVAQENQVKAMEELKDSNRQRNFDYMFANIKVYDGKSPSEFNEWTERLETACMISGRDIREAAIALSSGAVTKVIRSIPKKEPWSAIKAELKRCFSENKTKVHAATLFNNFRRQGQDENLRSYIYIYTKAHREATGVPAKEEYDVGRKLDFLTRLRNGAIANKISQSEDFMKYHKYTLEDCFEKALHLESRFQANEMMNLTREHQIDQAKEKKEKLKQKDDEGVDVYELNTDGAKGGNRKFGNCYKCGQPGHFSRECAQYQGGGGGGDSSDEDQRIVGKINHQLQAHTIISAKVLNDFIQKATKAEVNRKIYQSRLKQVQNMSQSQPQSQPQQTSRPKQVRIGQPPLQPTAPPPPMQPQQAPVQQSQGKPRGRPKGATTPKKTYTPATLAQVIAHVTSNPVPTVTTRPPAMAPLTPKRENLVVDSVQEIQHEGGEDEQESFTTDEVADLSSESEQEITEEKPPQEGETEQVQ